MTAENKAKELIEMFIEHVDVSFDENRISLGYLPNAKRCALFCVEEILELCKRQLLSNIEKPFWQEVKAAIEKY